MLSTTAIYAPRKITLEANDPSSGITDEDAYNHAMKEFLNIMDPTKNPYTFAFVDNGIRSVIDDVVYVSDTELASYKYAKEEDRDKGKVTRSTQTTSNVITSRIYCKISGFP